MGKGVDTEAAANGRTGKMPAKTTKEIRRHAALMRLNANKTARVMEAYADELDALEAEYGPMMDD